MAFLKFHVVLQTTAVSQSHFVNEWTVCHCLILKHADDQLLAFRRATCQSTNSDRHIMMWNKHLSASLKRHAHLIFPISSHPYNRDGSSPARAFIRAPEAWGISLEVKTRLFSPSRHWWTWCHWGWTWLACLSLTTECVCQAKHWGTAVSHCPWPRCAVSLPTTGPASGNAWAGALKKVAVQKARPLSLSWLSHI